MGDRLYRKKNSSVWYGSYYGPDGRRVCVCTKQQDRGAARQVLRDMERDAHTSLTARAKAGDAGETVASALHYLVDYGCADVSPATTGMYRQLMGHLARVIGPIDIGKLKMDDVHEYIQTRLKEEAHRETIRKELVALRRALTL